MLYRREILRTYIYKLQGANQDGKKGKKNKLRLKNIITDDDDDDDDALKKDQSLNGENDWL